MSYTDIVVASLCYQSAMYIVVRLAHRALTLGELGLMCFGGVSVFMEGIAITVARVCCSQTLLVIHGVLKTR